MPFRANEFIKRYQGYFRRHVTEYPKYLTGIFEHSNRVNGYSDPEGNIPVLIGDEHRALSVLKEGSHSSSIPIHPESSLAIDILTKNLGQNS